MVSMKNTRAWDIVPDKRVVADIMAWPAVNDKVYEADGAKVEGEAIRSEKRFIKSDGTVSKLKLKKRDRKETLAATPIHPDSIAGMNSILAFGDDDFDYFMHNRENETSAVLRAEEREQYLKDVAQVSEDVEDDEEEKEQEEELEDAFT